MDTPNTIRVIINKLQRMQEYLTQIDKWLDFPDEEILNDSKSLSAIERNFQLIVDAAIDINTTIIQEENLQSADDYQGTFTLVVKCGALSYDLAFKIASSVGLRNLLVHVYEKVDRDKEVHDIKRGIGQYREYMKEIFAYVEKKQGSKV